MDQITQIYNEIVSYDPSLEAHKDKIFSLIEQMVKAKPTFTFDPQRKAQLDARIADQIARAPVVSNAKPLSYWRMAKRGFSLASFWLIGVVAAASLLYIKIEHKQKIAQKQNTEIESTTDADASVALMDATNRNSNAEVTSNIATDSVVTRDLPAAQVAMTAKTVVATPPALPPQAQWQGNIGMTMMADPGETGVVAADVSSSAKIAIVFLTSDALNLTSEFSVPVRGVSDEMHLKSALVFKMKVNVLRPADEKMRDGKKIANGLEKSLQSRNVIVLHLNYPGSVLVAQELIMDLQSKGYLFVSLDELNDY